MLGTYLRAKDYFQACSKTLLKLDFSLAEQLSDEVHSACEEGRGIFVCGNGSGAITAMRFCEGLSEALNAAAADRKHGGAESKVMSLTDRTERLFGSPEQERFERILAMLLGNQSAPEDLVLFLSVDGDCPNLVHAAEWAEAHGRRTWAVAGHPGGKLRTAVRNCLRVTLVDPEIVHMAQGLVLNWILEEVTARIQRVGKYMKDRVVASL